MNEWWWGFLFGFCFCCFRRTHTPLHILCHICQSCVRLPNTPQIFKLHRYACIDTWAESPCEWLSSSRDRQLICHWNLYLEWVLWTFKDGEFVFYNVPWKNVLHWNRGAFFFFSLEVTSISLFSLYFSVSQIPSWLHLPIFVLFYTDTLSACPYAHSSKIYLTPLWPTLSIYFDLFAHLILVPLSYSVLSFQGFVTIYSLLLSVLGSLWDSCTMFSLSISSWIFLEIEAHNFCLQYFLPPALCYLFFPLWETIENLMK